MISKLYAHRNRINCGYYFWWSWFLLLKPTGSSSEKENCCKCISNSEYSTERSKRNHNPSEVRNWITFKWSVIHGQQKCSSALKWLVRAMQQLVNFHLVDSILCNEQTKYLERMKNANRSKELIDLLQPKNHLANQIGGKPVAIAENALEFRWLRA